MHTQQQACRPHAQAIGSRIFALTALLSLTLVSLAGCGEATVPARTTAKVKVVVHTATTPAERTAPSRSTTSPVSTTGAATTRAAGTSGATVPPPAEPGSAVARIDASSDQVLAEGKVHIASGAATDAEIKREIKAARKAGIVLPSGETAASFENTPSNGSGPAAETETPETPWNPRSKPLADWIVPVLQWASEHGWKGTVTSGYRTFYEQAQLNAAGDFSAPAGLSNHETTKYPGGAVDVTNPSQLLEVLPAYPGPLKLVGGKLGAVDPEHFSATGD